MKILILLVIIFMAVPAIAEDFDEAVDFYCLKLSYPQVLKLEKGPDGSKNIVLKDGRKITYSSNVPAKTSLCGNIKESMEQLYPLEPARPETPPGFAPGRKRSYDFFNSIYGDNANIIQKKLKNNIFMGKNIKTSPNATLALQPVLTKLQKIILQNKNNKEFLIPEGGFYWRKIAGEETLSAHSYGIALDFGVKKSPYWRWSKVFPHPLQKQYPTDIVKIFEDHGFIWGGKWHEYDIMHYEYRPELICKARMLEMKNKKFSMPESLNNLLK